MKITVSETCCLFPDATGDISQMEVTSLRDKPVVLIYSDSAYPICLTQEQVALILPALQAFVEHGKLK